MAVEVGGRSLSVISRILYLSFASSAYETLRSIGAKHHGSLSIILQVCSVCAFVSTVLVQASWRQNSNYMSLRRIVLRRWNIRIGGDPVKSFIVDCMQRIIRLLMSSIC